MFYALYSHKPTLLATHPLRVKLTPHPDEAPGGTEAGARLGLSALDAALGVSYEQQEQQQHKHEVQEQEQEHEQEKEHEQEHEQEQEQEQEPQEQDKGQEQEQRQWQQQQKQQQKQEEEREQERQQGQQQEQQKQQQQQQQQQEEQPASSIASLGSNLEDTARRVSVTVTAWRNGTKLTFVVNERLTRVGGGAETRGGTAADASEKDPQGRSHPAILEKGGSSILIHENEVKAKNCGADHGL